MGKNKKITIGYQYYFGIHMGIGRGEVDEIVHCKVADETAWSGSVSGNTAFTINAGDLFGGDKGEGGIRGTCMALMGGAAQAVYGPLANMLGGLVPAFRTRATIYYDGLVTSINPYPKPWAWRVRRALKGWDGAVWYPGRAVIPLAGGTIRAMNPAHIIVEALTNRDWGRGLNIGKLDTAAYQAVADTLYAEGFGMCFRWSRQDTVDVFIQLVLDHIGAVQALDRRTGLLTIRLIRQDYVYEDLPIFNFTNGLIAVEDLETAAFDSSTNTVIVTYRDPITNEERQTSPVQNLAAVQTQGTTLATSTEYFGIPTYDLAARCAERDLQISMGAMRRMTAVGDRRMAGLRPGSPFRIQAPQYGISDIVVRAGKVADGTLEGGHVSIVCMQDLFGMPNSTYITPQEGTFVPPDKLLRPVTLRKLMEASYRDLYQLKDPANFNLLSSSSAYVNTVGAKPAGLQLNYRLNTSTTTNIVGYSEVDTEDWAPHGALLAALPAAAGPSTVLLTDYSDLDSIEVGDSARCNNEEMQVTAINTVTGSVTLARGCVDTIPQAHAAGSVLWFTQDWKAEDPTEYATGQTVYAKLITHNSNGDLALGTAPVDQLQLIARQWKPYPPGNLRVAGQALGATDPTSRPVIFTWAHRDRVIEGDVLFPHTYGNLGPETGVTYTLRILTMAGVVKRTVADLTVATWEYTAAMITADGLDDLEGQYRFQLWSVRGGVASWQMYDISLVITKPGLGISLGYFLGGE